MRPKIQQYLDTAARRVPAMVATHELITTADGVPIVVHGRVAATRVLVVGLRLDGASATADLRLVVVDVGAAAARAAAVRLGAQFAATADVVVAIIYLSLIHI